MRHQVSVTLDGVRPALSRSRVERAALAALRKVRAKSANLSITFVSDRTIASINRKHLQHSGPTDVISFGLTPVEASTDVSGDIYIAPGVARRNAREHGVGVREELVRLVVHGVLHVAGYDHPEDEARYGSDMWRTQEGIVQREMSRA